MLLGESFRMELFYQELVRALCTVAVVEFQAKGDPGPAFHALAFQLSSVGFAVSSRFKAALAPFDIEPRQFSLLRAVGFAGGQSQKALAERLHVPTSSMVATIDDLEKRGLIERRPSVGDRRVKELHLTQRGKDLLQEVLPVAMETELAIRNALGPEDAARLGELLSRVGELFGVVPGFAHSSMQQGKECAEATDESLRH
jgi:DNA-binding MarR family transcriptional regulator